MKLTGLFDESEEADLICIIEKMQEAMHWPYPFGPSYEEHLPTMEDRKKFLPGKRKRIDYEYRRHGVAYLHMLFEPLVGKRHIRVTAQHTMKDFADCMTAGQRRLDCLVGP